MKHRASFWIMRFALACALSALCLYFTSATSEVKAEPAPPQHPLKVMGSLASGIPYDRIATNLWRAHCGCILQKAFDKFVPEEERVETGFLIENQCEFHKIQALSFTDHEEMTHGGKKYPGTKFTLRQVLAGTTFSRSHDAFLSVVEENQHLNRSVGQVALALGIDPRELTWHMDENHQFTLDIPQSLGLSASAIHIQGMTIRPRKSLILSASR